MSDKAKTTIHRRALQRVFDVLNRFDEIGGEVRDLLTEKYEGSQRAQDFVKRVQIARGKQFRTTTEQVEDRLSEEEATAAAAPDAGAVEEKKGLADPDIAAQIYGRSSCPFTGRAIRLLEDRKTDYDFIDMDEEEHASLDGSLIAETKQNTHPWVYLRGKFIGGYNALNEVDRLGQLKVATMSAEEKAADPRAQDIVVTARPNTDDMLTGEQ